MASISGFRKSDLQILAIKFEVEIFPNDTIPKLVRKVMDSPDYDESMALSKLKLIEEDRLEKARLEKDKADKEFELAKIRAERETDSLTLTSSQIEKQPKILLKNVLPKYEMGKSEIFLYLNLLSRQALKAQIERSQWVTTLLGLLTIEQTEVILREPTDQTDDFKFVKKKFLEHFKISAEDFRKKFSTSNRSKERTGKYFSYEITNYVDQNV